MGIASTTEFRNNFKIELEGEAKVVATGGLARRMATDIRVIDVVNYDLVLIGLRLLEGGVVLDRVRIENHQIGLEAFPNQAAVLQTECPRRK